MSELILLIYLYWNTRPISLYLKQYTLQLHRYSRLYVPSWQGLPQWPFFFSRKLLYLFTTCCTTTTSFPCSLFIRVINKASSVVGSINRQCDRITSFALLNKHSQTLGEAFTWYVGWYWAAIFRRLLVSSCYVEFAPWFMFNHLPRHGSQLSWKFQQPQHLHP